MKLPHHRSRPWAVRTHLVAIVAAAAIVFVAGVTGQTLLAAGALLVEILVALAIHRGVIRPLRRVTAAVVRAGRESTPEGIEPSGPAELHQFAGAFNTMLGARLDFESRLVHQALHDILTGLPNRALFVDRLHQALGRTDRSGKPVAVLFVNVDRFQLLNDSLGHDAGDRVLVVVADRLAEAVRPGDTVARFGGDEFMVLCEVLDDATDAATIADRLGARLAEPIPIDGQDVHLRVSIGIALAGGEGRAEDLLRNADTAMCQAKEQGRAGWALLDEELRTRAAARMEHERDLRTSLERGELSVHYQPEVDLATGRVTGAEALLRWHHPERGSVPPLAFIPIAEETGLILPIGNFVLEEACRQAAAWNTEGHDIRMSVNVSLRQLNRGDLPEFVAAVLAATGLAAGRLRLEVTESLLVNTSGPALSGLQGLRDLGVQVAIDDFGTGYSSLASLQQFPVDVVKIDRSFVAGLGRDRRSGALVAAIVAMARALDLRVVAEGIEELEQWEELVGYGCDAGQGFLFSRPRPAGEVGALLDLPALGPRLLAA